MNDDTQRIPITGRAPARAIGHAPLPVLQTGTGPQRPKVRLRSRKIWGIPVPLVAIIAVLAMGGAAFAAIIFFGRVTVSGNVRSTPDLRWMGTVGNDRPCVIPAPGTDGGGSLTPTIDASGRLFMAIDAYPGAQFDVWAFIGLPTDGNDTHLKITGIDLGNASQLTATLEDTFSNATDGSNCQVSFGTGGSVDQYGLLRSATTGHNFLMNGDGHAMINGFYVWAVHIRVTVKVDAPAGPITGVATGLTVTPATP